MIPDHRQAKDIRHQQACLKNNILQALPVILELFIAFSLEFVT